MFWACFVFLALVFSNTRAKEEESNEVTPLRPPINLDANLRRALLKALTELENEENEKAKLNKQPSDAPEEFNLPHIDTSDKIVEKASASALSFFASTGSPTSTTTEKLTVIGSTTTEEAQPIVFIQKSKGIQHKPITSFEKHIDPISDTEQILTSASSSFTGDKYTYKTEETRSIGSGNSNSLETKVKPEITTAATTTTSTEESEAKVEDVQFFSAPLVAAFTVHQDERGVPKKVEPIYKANAQNIQGISHSLQKVEQKIRPTQAPEHVKAQLVLQQKQKALEEEIARLRQHQAQQNLLIRQQQALHEQQLYKQNLYAEQLRVQNNRRPFQPLHNVAQPATAQPNFNSFNPTTPQPATFNNFQQLPFAANSNFNTNKQTDLNNNSRIKGSLVSFQPSITFNHHSESLLPLNAQQLPVKNAVDFRGQFQPFANSFNFAPSVSLTAPKHNRVFRQEATTGNFLSGNSNSGLLDSYNQQQSQRFFRSSENGFNNFNRVNQQVQPPVVNNNHLNNLLYNSGIYRGKQQEDLNIVSKVLSLNHYGNNNVGQDFRFGSFSSINEQRVPAPKTLV